MVLWGQYVCRLHGEMRKLGGGEVENGGHLLVWHAKLVLYQGLNTRIKSLEFVCALEDFENEKPGSKKQKAESVARRERRASCIGLLETLGD